MRWGGVLSPVLFAVYVDDLIKKLECSGLGFRIGNSNICCLFYADDIVLLSGSVSKLQLMINLCYAELESLDLNLNFSKCHVLRIGAHFQNICDGLNINGVVISPVDSLTYLGTDIL